MMRLLVLHHPGFSQDIDSLRAAAGGDVRIRVLDHNVLRDEALRVFPESVATGLEAYTLPEHAEHRQEFAVRLERQFDELFMAEEFDAFVVPSDSFFYVREAGRACRRLGIPFFCVQKETTISPGTMEDIAEPTLRYAPPVADFMTVCSERSRDFWMRTGWRADRLDVTGQPRWDFFLQPERWPERLPWGEPGPTVLFFSYMLDAYHPKGSDPRGLEVGKPVWADLRRQTEEALWTLASRGWRVLVKPHPQQPIQGERRRLRDEVGALYDRKVFAVPNEADARHLITGSDVVVGFQTTALIESLIPPRPVVYTGWDPEAARIADRLIPFQDWDGAVSVARRPEDLVDLIEQVGGRDPAPADRALAERVIEEHLGKVDGYASERTLAHIRRLIEQAERERAPEVTELRRDLAGRRPPLRIARRARYGVRRLRVRVGAALGR